MNVNADAVTARATRIVATLDIPQKIRLLSGADFWNTEAVSSADLPAIMLTDGPHGLRKQVGAADHIGLADSVPATCFPTAVTLASTWNPELAERVGQALGRETRKENVGVLLGPGLNIKRHPAGGRNFEYFSEDPLLSGDMAAALVRGIQSEGVGACLKHYAANNQERYRMRADSVVDERTLRELYLTGFERAVKGSQPWAVMCSYNKVNGEHADVSRRLLTEVLRDEWGFDGLVMTDWLATSDRVAAVRAGLDLEMPGSAGTWDQALADALESGQLTREDLDVACERVIALLLRALHGAAANGPATFDIDAHHALAREAATAGTVLLTNDGILPLAADDDIALIGAFAASPRYQGAGSSLVSPTRLDSLLKAFTDHDGPQVRYAPAYDATSGETTDALVAEAVAAARDAHTTVLMVGLPASYESEAYDRVHLGLPAAHERLIAALAAVTDRLVVVVSAGAPIEMPWADVPQAILVPYLGGQAGGSALHDVLTGTAEPTGRLAESFPVSGDDLPSTRNFSNHPTQVLYRENLYVGYRFHETFATPARFAFGHGLGYTSFTLGSVKVKAAGDTWTVTVPVSNTGARNGVAVVQLYVHDVASTLHRPEHELKGFARVELAAGRSGEAVIALDRRSFAVYDVADAAWKVEAGEFELRAGLSSVDIHSRAVITVESDDTVTPVPAPVGPRATDAEFAALLGHPVPAADGLLPFTADSTVSDLNTTWVGRRVKRGILAKLHESFGGAGDADNAAMMESFLESMPLRGLAMTSGGRMSLGDLNRLLRTLNATSWIGRRPPR